MRITPKAEYSTGKNVLNGVILHVYYVGFMLLVITSWPMLLESNGQKHSSHELALTMVLFFVIGLFSLFTYVMRMLIKRRTIDINFWAFMPAICYGVIYGLFSLPY